MTVFVKVSMATGGGAATSEGSPKLLRNERTNTYWKFGICIFAVTILAQAILAQGRRRVCSNGFKVFRV